VITYGAAIQDLRFDGVSVALGFPSIDGYVEHGAFGKTVGRFANRIAGSRFSLDGVEFELESNEGPNILHGGPLGFGKRVWEVVIATADAIRLRYTSPDGEMGFPGTLAAEVEYAVEDDRLRIDYRATTDAPTVVNFTNHAYWNLAGSIPVLDHLLEIDADEYTPTDRALIPTGEIAPVAGTPLDFRAARPIGADVPEHGFDHNFVLRGAGLRRAARVVEPVSGRSVDVLTTEPGLQIYVLSLDGAPNVGLALETQHFPDSPNRPNFPSTVLRPGERFESTTVYAFST
jgi:aldose 1-epimerase